LNTSFKRQSGFLSENYEKGGDYL